MAKDKKSLPVKADKEAIIKDVKRLYKTSSVISRDFYRANGKFGSLEWQAHFPTFSDLLAAAGVPPTRQAASKVEPESNITDEVDGSKRSIFGRTRISTLEELLEFCGVDQRIWEVKNYSINKRDTATSFERKDKKTGEREFLVEPLYQVRATLRKRDNIVAIIDEVAALKDIAKASARYPRVEIGCIVASTTGNLLELSVPDLHIGKLAWSQETGYGNYDTKIALEVFRQALASLLDRVSHYKFEQILFVVGNDLLHSDDTEGRTTSGTYVDTDGRYHKTFVAARDMLIEAVERLRKIAPVKIISCYGNHDKLASWHVTDSLECYFHNYSDVEVDNTPRARKYIRHGKVMLMFTHGHTGKRDGYPLTMASEEPEMWGATKYREAHTGHTHTTKTDELHGVRVRILPALCETDAWHAENAFTGNLRTAEAYVWNAEEGLIAQAFYNAD